MNLYRVKAEYLRLLDKEELSREDMQELDSLHVDLEDKLIEVGKAIKNKEAERMAVEAEIKIMQNRLDKLDKNIANMKEWLVHTMQETSIKQVDKFPCFKLALYRNPPKVHIEDEDKIPMRFIKMQQKIIKSIEKNEIRKALQNGESIEGCALKNDFRINFS